MKLRAIAASDARAWALAPAALAFTGLAVAAPLAVYTVTLALFGLPHVLSELRYVDRRFGRRVEPRLLAVIAGLLALIVGARAATVFHLLPAKTGVVAELSLVVLLALSVARGPLLRRALAIAVALVVGTSAAMAPFDTAVTFAVLHNLTPLGFLWQLSPGARPGEVGSGSPSRTRSNKGFLGGRLRVMAPAAAGLLGLPLLVATGLPRLLLGAISLDGLDPLGAGPLARHLFVYVPNALAGTGHALDFFTASVTAQVGHYLSVIVVLPLMLARIEPQARGVLPWPQPRWFLALLALAALGGLLAFASGFADARGTYGIFASLHAWLEIPVLILALTGDQLKASSPSRHEAELATSETSMAR